MKSSTVAPRYDSQTRLLSGLSTGLKSLLQFVRQTRTATPDNFMSSRSESAVLEDASVEEVNLTGSISLAEVMLYLRTESRSGATPIPSLYLSLRLKCAPSTTLLSSLLNHSSGAAVLKAVLRTSGFHEAKYLLEGRREVSSPTEPIRNDMQVYKPNYRIAEHKVFDLHRLSKRINAKFRLRQPGARVDQVSIQLVGGAVRQRIRKLSALLARSSETRRSLSDIFPQVTRVHAQPRDQVRELNLNLAQRTSVRREEEHQKLLQLGESSNKKKRKTSDEEYDEELLIRAERAREEEEERQLADAANEATRSALGDAKYLKWFSKTHQASVQNTESPKRMREVLHEAPREMDAKDDAGSNAQPAGTKVTLADVLGVLRSEKTFSAVFPRLLDKDNSFFVV